MIDYAGIVAAFAKDGARIINTDPKRHYTHIGALASPSRPLEPGFIPVDRPAKVVTVSYYPNASELTKPEFVNARKSFVRWGQTGEVTDYADAYADWLRFLPDVPFYRDFNDPIFRRVGIAETEFAWLPLVKLPLPAKTKPHEDDVLTDRFTLWDQLLLLQPQVILTQGLDAHNVVSGMCRDKPFPKHIVFQRIGRVGTNAYHEAEYERVSRELDQVLA